MAKTKEEIKEPVLTKAEIKAQAIQTKKAEMDSEYTKLYNVVDTRAGQYHSEAIVKNTKHFMPVEEYSE